MFFFSTTALILYLYFNCTACSSSSAENITSDTEHIQSPFYPDTYRNNQECRWLVTAPSETIVKFILFKFALAQGDFLEIRDGKDHRAVVLKNFTSEEPASDNMHTSTGQFMLVTFKSDREYVGEGFRMRLFFQNRPISKYQKLINAWRGSMLRNIIA